MVTIEVVGLRRGTRGFHFHASGRCEPPEFGSAGPHFNPAKRQHGFDNPRGPHLGDLPNLIVQGEGSTVQSLFARGATLAPGPQSVRGRALVIHAERDDYRSDPSGDSGDRIACGVVPGV
jgi:Cu-Zn family superoxide dismutase